MRSIVQTLLRATGEFKAAMILSACMVFAFYSNLSAVIVLNEAFIDPNGGTDDFREFVEILSTTGSDSLADVWLLEIESELVGTLGRIDAATNLSSATYSAGGFVVIGNGYMNGNGASNPYGLTSGLFDSGRLIENDSVLALVRSSTPILVGTDIDTDDDLVIDVTPWDVVLDAVALTETTFGIYFGIAPQNSTGTDAPDAAARFINSTTPLAPSDWFAGEHSAGLTFTGTTSSNFPAGYVLTPGAQNVVVPEPSAFLLIGIVAAGIVGYRNRNLSLSMLISNIRRCGRV